MNKPNPPYPTYDTIKLASQDRVATLTLNRPARHNALNHAMMDELTDVLQRLDVDDSIACIVLTGGDKVFAAGADVSEMKDLSAITAYQTDFITRNWEALRRVRKPVIAAVVGYALGGGCELAMMCDIVLAADNAKFGQPEINLGIFPGAGATQRLPRAIGKAKAMDMILTGRLIDAQEAERAGLVSRVFATEQLLDQAHTLAQRIAAQSLPALLMAKEAVNRSFETSLAEGILFERRLFQTTFGYEDQKEGMSAFLEKRIPKFNNR